MLRTPVVVAEVILALLIVIWTCIEMRKRPSVRAVLAALSMLIVGSIVGWYCAFHVRFPVGDDRIHVGIPIPFIVLQLENGEWIDYIGPGFLFSIPIVAAVCLLPVPLALFLRRVSSSRTSDGRISGQER